MAANDNDAKPPTVAKVVGRNARALRGDHKMELVARAAKAAGLKWGTGRVADLENGDVSPTIPTLFMLSAAFSSLLRRPIGLADLLAGTGSVGLSNTATAKLSELRAALAGQAVGAGVRGAKVQDEAPPVSAVAGVSKTRASFLAADTRLCDALDLNAWRGAELMNQLWGRSFSDERDRRGGPGANAQKRGRISRQLKIEMEEAIRGDN